MHATIASGIACTSLAVVLLGAGPCPGPYNAPAPNVPTAAVAPIPPSTISVPISVGVAAVQAKLEAAVPKANDAKPYYVHINGGADNVEKGVSLGYHVERGPLSLTASGSSLTLATNLSYWVQARARKCVLPNPFGTCGNVLIYGSCGVGEPLRTASVALTTVLSVDAQWRLISHTVPSNVQPGNRCKVTIFNFDVTDNVIDGLRGALNNLSGTLDNELTTTADLPTHVADAWKRLWSPFTVAPDVYLLLQPTSLGTTPLQSNGDHVTIGLSLQAKPVIEVAEAPPTVTPPPLPARVDAAGGNQFIIAIPVDVSTQVITKQLRDALKIDQGGIRYPPGGARFVSPTDVDMYAYGNKAVIRVAFSGTTGSFLGGFKGTAYFEGTPTFNAATQTLSVPDLDYTVQTRNLILKVLNAVEADAVRNDLRQRLTVNLASQIQAAQKQLSSALNRTAPPFTLTGQVSGLQLLGIYAKPGESVFRAVIRMDGTLEIGLTP